MGRFDRDYAVVADGLDGITLALGKNVLAAAGIPCLAHGPDFDMAELGRAAHDQIRGGALLVPHALLERARAALEEAWGPEEDAPGPDAGRRHEP